MPVVHAITDDAVLSHPRFVHQAVGVLRALGPRGALHLRARRLTTAQLHAIALTLRAELARTGCHLVVNDRVDLAVAVGAWGAQLAWHSLTPPDVRCLAPALALGASVHDPVEVAALAPQVDWLLAGHVFATASHPGTPPRGVAFVNAVVREAGGRTGVPVVAVGGVTPSDVARLRAAGAHGVAAIRGIWSASDAGAAASDYLTSHDDDADDAHLPRHRGERGAP